MPLSSYADEVLHLIDAGIYGLEIKTFILEERRNLLVKLRPIVTDDLITG